MSAVEAAGLTDAEIDLTFEDERPGVSWGALATKPIWLTWREEDGRRKVPYAASGRGKGSSTDPTCWGTRAEAETGARRLLAGGRNGGVGIVLGQDATQGFALGGVDLDTCRDPDTGEIQPWATDVARMFGSYTEVSPSNTGLKAFFVYDPADLPALQAAIGPGTDGKPRLGKAWKRGAAGGHPPAIELFLGGRYFTVTDDRLAECPPDMRLADKALLLRLIREIGPRFMSPASAPTSKPGRDNSRSGRALALAGRIRRRGGTLDDFRDALTGGPELSGWAADERQVARTWQKAGGDAVSDMEGFALNEDGVALAFAARFRGRLLYDHHAARWYRWADTHWQIEETRLAFAWARDICRDMARVNPDGPGVRALAQAKTAGAVERFAQADRVFAVTSEGWDTDPWLLGTPGGTVDLRSGTRSPARPDDRITRLVAATPADGFDESLDCPRWMAFLHEATAGDTALIRFLRQWAGYCLSGSVKEHALLFVYGPGGNGKSVFLNVLAGALGGYAQTAAAETFAATGFDRHPTEVAMLRGARLVVASETEEGRAWAEARIKALTGGDKISARFMRQDFFTFEPTFKLTIVGNHKPALHAVDDAMKRRINIVPFLHKPTRPDPDLEAELRAEWPGILAWAIQGCLDWQRNGLTRPEAVRAATADYFEAQDLMAQWLEECCEQDTGFAGTTPALMADWRAFVESRGSREDASTRTFGDRLAARGFPRIKNTHGIRGRGFAGLRIREWEGA